jgi:hypothetical protein
MDLDFEQWAPSFSPPSFNLRIPYTLFISSEQGELYECDELYP